MGLFLPLFTRKSFRKFWTDLVHKDPDVHGEFVKQSTIFISTNDELTYDKCDQ